MISISDIFSTDDSNNNIHKSKITDKSPATNQGKKFKKYQNKISNSLENNAEILSGKEGFTELGENGLTAKTNKIIDKTDYSNQQQIIDNLRKEHQNTLQQYEKLLAEVSGDTTGYINRVNPNNPYLNKVVKFTTGHVCYVTNQGVVKWIRSNKIWQSLSISQTVQIPLNIPWQETYNTPGTQIQTNPPLVSGTNVKMGQSFGSEGSNVFVNQLLPENTQPSYMGCYAASPNNDNMTFIGEKPPSADVSIKNGNFAQSQLPDNTFKYLSWDVTTVPGWNFNCVLLNNSSAWKYPIPYPNGNQCASIQKTQQLWTNDWINFNVGVSYTLSFSACGRNCCDGSEKSNPINIGLEGKTLYTLDATVDKWKTYSFKFKVDSSGGQRVSFIGTWKAGDRSTAIKNVSLSGSSELSGTYTYNDCMQSAVQQGYQYFGLQNVNAQTSTGYCAVSNSSPAISQYGNSTVPSKMVSLWSSNTAEQPGNTAILLANTSQLQILNSSGTSIYSTPVSKNITTQLNPYIGCYKFENSTNLPQIGKNWQYSQNDCIDEVTNKGYNYVGLAGGPKRKTNGTTMVKRCLGFNDLKTGQLNGISKTCDYPLGGTGANALYSTDNLVGGGACFLVLQDDGNMVIYRGTSPSDNQGLIWSTQTNGKQQSANPNVAASKGKYGQNWMPSAGTLAPGDFIGSTDGKLALIMQSDGNLVLYTYEMETNCQKMSDGNIGGGLLGNAAYDIGKIAITSNIGKLAYVDGNSDLHDYSSNNQIFANTYSTSFQNTDSIGNNIPGAAFANSNLESCQSACNKNTDCAGFVLDVGGKYSKTCFPKTKQMYPYGGSISTSSGVNFYIRDKMPTSPPIGVPQTTSNIDTVKYTGYTNGGRLDKSYGLANLNSVQKQQLEQLHTKLNMLSNKITSLNTSFNVGSNLANYQADNNVTGINHYIKDIKITNKKSKLVAGETSGGIQNILNDSDIVVLQKNYDYLLWSILAAGTVLVSMNLINK